MSKGVGFQDVDRTGEAPSFVVYLDTMTALSAVQAYKQRILAALGLQARDARARRRLRHR